MTEQQFALQVRRVLDDAAERLPYRVSHRLEAARRAALGRMPQECQGAAEARDCAHARGSADIRGRVAAPSRVGSGAGIVDHRGSPAPTPAAGPASSAGAAVALAPRAALSSPTLPASRPLWLRAAVALLPLILVALGLIGISAWHELDVADETAEVDLAVLTDDIPISAYADRGFGVFLKNSQQ